MKNRILVFLSLTFLLSWGACLYLYMTGGVSSPLSKYILIGVMMAPGISSLITRAVTKQGFRKTGLRVWLNNGEWKSYFCAWLGVPLFILAGIALFYAFNLQMFDPSLSAVRQLSGGLSEVSDGQLLGKTLMNILLAVLTSPFLSGIPSLGAELGWRGYLLPELSDLIGEGPANIATGIIWGIWHAPLICLGQIYGSDYKFFPAAGIFTVIVFCVFLGGFLGRVSMMAESIWPSVIAYALVIGLSDTGMLFMAQGASPSGLIGPSVYGIAGGAGIILAGCHAIYMAFKRPVYQTRHDIFIRY